MAGKACNLSASPWIKPTKCDEFAKEIGLNYPTLIGGFGAMELSKSLGNNLMALPFTVVLDRKGDVVHTQLGELKPEKLRSIITQLLCSCDEILDNGP